MRRDKDRHPQPSDAMQDISQECSLPFVAQGSGQADVPSQAHLSLLLIRNFEPFLCPGSRWNILPRLGVILTFLNGNGGICRIGLEKEIQIVKSFLVISFQTSSNKTDIDLYNPNCFPP